MKKRYYFSYHLNGRRKEYQKTFETEEHFNKIVTKLNNAGAVALKVKEIKY